MHHLRPALLALLLAALPAFAQESAPWHDPSPHKAQFVTVDKDVKLEVLDWGGNGQPVVLLAGHGLYRPYFRRSNFAGWPVRSNRINSQKNPRPFKLRGGHPERQRLHPLKRKPDAHLLTLGK